MITILIGGILTLVLMAAASRLMLIRSLAKLECRSCETKFGWRSAFHNKIIIRVLSVTWNDETPFFSRNIEYVHMREIQCPNCHAVSTMDARGNELTESVLGTAEVQANQRLAD